MPGAAVAAVSTVVGVASASKQAKAAKNAANAQVAADNQATALQGAIYNDQRNLSSGDILAGAQAKARQMLMEGIPPDQVKAYLTQVYGSVNGPSPTSALPPGAGTYYPAQAPVTTNSAQAPTSWVDNYQYAPSSPSYQFRLDQGLKALQRSAAARQDLFSGQTGQALTDYAQNFAAQDYEANYRRLGDLSGAGRDAQGQTINVGSNFGAQAGANIKDAAQARASGYVNASNAYTNGANNFVAGIGQMYGYGKGLFGK